MGDFTRKFGKYIYILVAVSLLGTGGLFSYLETLGMEVTCEFEPVCDQLNCTFYCDVRNPTSQSQYLYNNGDFAINFSPNVTEYKTYVKYYGKWRFTNFTNETRLPNIPDERKYVFVFPRYSTKHFKFEVQLADADSIQVYIANYSGNLTGWKPEYDICYKTVPLVEYNITEITENRNGTNVTYNQITSYVMGYDDVPYECGIRKGVVLGGNFYENANIKNNNLIEWTVPTRDRNFEEFGDCREFEKQKGICKETTI